MSSDNWSWDWSQLGLGVHDEIRFVAANPAIIANMRVIIEIAAANEPEYLVGVVGRDTGMFRDTHYCFEQTIIIGVCWTQPEANENISQLHVGFGEIVIAKFFEKVTGQGEADPGNFLIQEHRECRTQPVIVVE